MQMISKAQSTLDKSRCIFVNDENDEASFSKDDIIMKLPAPTPVAGTSRTAQKYIFSCDFSRWIFFIFLLSV